MSLSARATRSDVVVAPESGRALRVGGQTIAPGASRVVFVPLPGREDEADALPVWVAVGARSGPRVTVIGAPRGYEVGAARVAASMRSLVEPSVLRGGLVVAPVLRPGGRFVARGQALRDTAAWTFPGDPGGNRRAREAFAVFSELVVGSSLLLLLTAADPGSATPLTVRGDFDDPRVRQLLPPLGAVVAVHAKPNPKSTIGSLTAAARDRGIVLLELCGRTEPDGDQAQIAAVVAVLATVGATAPARGPAVASPRKPTLITRVTALAAPLGGLLEQVARAGSLVEKGNVLARVVPPLLGRSVDVVAPHDGMILQATIRDGVRPGAPLFLVGRLSQAALLRARKRERRAVKGVAPVDRVPSIAGGESLPLRVGWVERVSLPGLGVERLRAKIDTGARTSALHVTRMTTVGTTAGPHRRTILELTLPVGSRRQVASTTERTSDRPSRTVRTVRVLVREYVQVKDSSGRTERRPVIETTLRLGRIERRIRVTLTNRGDMLFPLLIGRTALGPGVVVDPAHRLLLSTNRPTTSARRKRDVSVEKTK